MFCICIFITSLCKAQYTSSQELQHITHILLSKSTSLFTACQRGVFENSNAKYQKWKLFLFSVQTVLNLEPHTLKVFFVTVQLVYQLHPIVRLIPFVINVLSQLADVLDICLVDPCLWYVPDLVVDWVQVRTFRWPRVQWDEKVWRQSFLEFDCIVVDFYMYATSK